MSTRGDGEILPGRSGHPSSNRLGYGARLFIARWMRLSLSHLFAALLNHAHRGTEKLSRAMEIWWRSSPQGRSNRAARANPGAPVPEDFDVFGSRLSPNCSVWCAKCLRQPRERETGRTKVWALPASPVEKSNCGCPRSGHAGHPLTIHLAGGPGTAETVYYKVSR